MIGGGPWDREAGLTQLKSGACVALLGICRPVPPVWGWGSVNRPRFAGDSGGYPVFRSRHI